MAEGMFNPEGPGYDFETALKAGLRPDETGHWPSRHPETGLILKGRSHPTFHKTIAADEQLGYQLTQTRDGRYYSYPTGPVQGPPEAPYTQTTPGPAPDLTPYVEAMRQTFRETEPEPGY